MKEYLKNFKVESGGIENLEETIEAFDLPRHAPDRILVEGEHVATFKDTTAELTFPSEKARKKFKKEVKKSGIVQHLAKELELEEVPMNIIALTITTGMIDYAKEYYKKEREEENKLSSFVNSILNRSEKPFEKLQKHRHKLQSENTKKAKKLKP